MNNEKRFFDRYEIKLSIFVMCSFILLLLSARIIDFISKCKCGNENICYMHYGEGIISHDKIKHIYRKYSMDENMTPLYSVYADMGIGHDILLYQCHTDVEYRKFMNDLYKEMEK
jgi:hypothetical protein